VFQPVGRGDQFVQTEPRTGLLGDGVADVGVGVDERRQDDGVAVGLGLLDRSDLAVFDHDSSLDRFELAAPEDRPLELHGR
jgi:hypothetical protein